MNVCSICVARPERVGRWSGVERRMRLRGWNGRAWVVLRPGPQVRHGLANCVWKTCEVIIVTRIPFPCEPLPSHFDGWFGF